VYSDATISDCGLYRFSLWRALQPSLNPLFGHSCLFVINNPSTADATDDDPTIRRVKGFAETWGFGRVYVANCNPYRATDPKAAKVPPAEVLEQNDVHMAELAWRCEWVVAAWGGKADRYLSGRAFRLLRTIKPVRAIMLTKAGEPKHPLYLPGDAQPFIWQTSSGNSAP
jgi:hypothetical protein